MSNQTRSEMLWRLFGDEHPKFCVGYYGLSRGADILCLPEEQPLPPDADAAKVFFEELDALPDAALAERVAEADRKKAAAEEAAHPFNRPEAVADENAYDYWSKAAYWTIEEGVALLLEREPREVIKKKRVRYEKVARFYPSDCGPKYVALYELVTRAVSAKQVGAKPAPGAFLAWAKRNWIDVPPPLEAAVLAHGHQVADWKTRYDEMRETAAKNKAIAETERARAAMLEKQLEKQAQTYKGMLEKALSERDEQTAKWKAALDEAQAARDQDKPLATRERQSLLKIVLGMAIACYQHDPRATRTTTVSAILTDLDTVGISVSDDTIRKHLRDAAEFAPPAEPE